VSVPGYSGEITLSRSHLSFAGDQSLGGWPPDPVTGVFGPGWTASLEGGPAGLAGLQVIDNTGLDGSIVFVDGEGEPLVYANPTSKRAYPTSGTTTYKAATVDTAAAGVRLTVTGTGTAMRLTLTEDDGTATTWAPLAAPSTAGTTWRPETISEPGQTGKTTFGRDDAGRVTWIIAPVPTGMTGSCPTTGTLARGCRAIKITYATTPTATSATPGDVAGQVKAVSAWLWNPATAAMTQTTVATYAYDTSGRLVQMRDPRTGLGTDYTWDGASTRIASVRATGLAATKLGYSSGKLARVSREAPVTGGPDVTTARYVYAVATSGAGLPTLTAAAVKRWYQAKDPVAGYAVFGPDYTGPVSGTGIDWSYADLSYVDDLGYTVNTASYGASAWQVTGTDYDTATSNITRTLTATATATAAADPAMTAAGVDALSTQTFYNTEQTDGATVVLPAGARVTDVYGPSRRVVLADGTEETVRPHTRTVYDQGAPNNAINSVTGQRYSLPTTVSVFAATGIGVDLETVSSTTTGYGKLNNTDTSEGDGWALGLATTSTGGITRTTRYDTLGRVTETRQPLSTTGADAGTTKTVYYTANAPAGADPASVNRPEWAGLTCRTYPAAAPSSGPTPPATATTGYSMWLAPTTVTETSGTATRTTSTTYDAAGRPVSSKTTTSGLAGSTARPGSYTRYRSDNGLVQYTGWLNTAGTDAETDGRTETSYDRWGRPTTVLGDAGTVTTSYDTAGRVAAVTDATGTTTYGYDGPGERRGLPTTLTVTRPGPGGALTWTAAYDREGRITRQTLPGRATLVTTYDQAGQPEALSYLGQVTPVTVGIDPDTGETTYTPGTPLQDQPWLTWSTLHDVTGRVRLQATGTGAAFDDGTGVATIEEVTTWDGLTVGEAAGYGREYRYDPAGRLTYARNAEAAWDPTTQALVSTCTERVYTFDDNGRRTTLATTTHDDGDCASSGTTKTMATTGWDTADRPTTGRDGTSTYVYDLFGRQTSIPAADAPNPGKGNITLGYYDDDLPRTVTQGETSTTFTLDAAGRRATQTTTTSAGPQPGTTTTVRRYTDGSDNPAWIETTTPTAPDPVTTRFTESIGGDLSATITPDGTTSLSLPDPHGDIVTTITINPSQTSTTPAVAITGWASYDEYGTPTDATGGQGAIDQVDGPLGYGWLGVKQRSTTTDTAGLTLMGVRLYNPTRGQFTSLDPIPGGNTTAYAYPQDPVGLRDLSGMSQTSSVKEGCRCSRAGQRIRVDKRF
jgi:RHS repeat-associated protein